MKHYINKHKDLIDCCIILLILSACTAFLCASRMDLHSLNSYKTAFVSAMIIPEDIVQFFIKQTLVNIILCLIIFLSGFSLLGIPFIDFMIFLKGFQIGFTMVMFLFTYKSFGVIGIVMTVLPQMILDCCAVVICASSSIHLSGMILSTLMDAKLKLKWKQFINRKLNHFIVSVVMIFISSIFKSTAGLFLLQLFLKLQI